MSFFAAQVERVKAAIAQRVLDLQGDAIARLRPVPDARLPYPGHRGADTTNSALLGFFVARFPGLTSAAPGWKDLAIEAIKSLPHWWTLGRAVLQRIAVRAFAQALGRRLRSGEFPPNSPGWRTWKSEHALSTLAGIASGQLAASVEAADVDLS